MSELKTKPSQQDPKAFLNAVKDAKRRKEAFEILDLMKKVTNEEPVMWGPSIIGFGTYHYKYATGREGDWMLTGFSPRNPSLTIYIMPGLDKYEELIKKLGKFKTGVSCLYINKLDDIDLTVLEVLIASSVKALKNQYFV